jgi:Glyoxalase-like domain
MLPLDHVTVAGTDLRRMQATLSAIGIETVFGGAHSEGATEMAMVSFPDGSYLELIAPRPNAAANHPWANFLTGNAGPCAWAVSAADLDSELRRLQSAGIPVSPPVANGRLQPDGVRLEWKTATCGAGPPGSFFPFLIQDLTARELRAFPQGAPGNREFRGIARVVLTVRDLHESIALYRQAYGLADFVEQTDPAFQAQLAVASDAPIVLAAPLAGDSWLAFRLAQFREAPCAILLDAGEIAPAAVSGQSRWCDLDIRWFDRQALGWRLGWVRARGG